MADRGGPAALGRDADLARPSPLEHKNLNVLGRYGPTTSTPAGGTLRDPDAVGLDDEDDGEERALSGWWYARGGLALVLGSGFCGGPPSAMGRCIRRGGRPPAAATVSPVPGGALTEGVSPCLSRRRG